MRVLLTSWLRDRATLDDGTNMQPTGISLQAAVTLSLGVVALLSALGGWLIWLHNQLAGMRTRIVLLEGEQERSEVKKELKDLREEFEWMARLLLIIADREGVDTSQIRRTRPGVRP